MRAGGTGKRRGLQNLDDQLPDPHVTILECVEQGGDVLDGLDRIEREFDSRHATAGR